MAGEREGIPVARARVPVSPFLDKAEASKMQRQTTEAVSNAANEAGRAFERGLVPKVTAALQAMTGESDKAAQRSEAALKAAATRAAQAQAKAIDWVIEKEGQGAAIAVRMAFNAADEKHKALLGLSARHKRVLSTMGMEEEQAVKAMVRASQMGSERKQAVFKETSLRYKAELRERQSALIAHLREGLRDYKAAKTQEIGAEKDSTLAYKAELMERLAALRTQLSEAVAAEEAVATRRAGLLATAATRWNKGSQAVEHMGMQAAEVGALLTRNVVAPLALAGGVAVDFGIKATDSFDAAANSLGGLGVSILATKKLLNNLQKFAINSSFSLEDMNEFAPQYVRILASHGMAPDKAAAQSEALIKAIANNAAKGGITDTRKLAQAMQQVAYIMDTDKLTLRNMKPFENNTNISAEAIAKMLGYKDSNETSIVYANKQHWARRYTNKTDKTHYSKNAKGKWVADENGDYIKNSLGGYDKDGGHYEWVKDNRGHYIQEGFENGKPKYVIDKGTRSKKLSASAQFRADMTASEAPSGQDFIKVLIKSGKSVEEAAKRAQNATIKGRLQGMKETAQRDLMGLFAKRDKKGNFEVRRDPDTGMLTHVKTPLYENVLKALDGLKDLWTEVFPGLKVAAKAFVDGLNKVISISLGTVRFIKDHPALQSFLKTLIAFTLKALPLLIAFGVAAKILGKTGKLIGGVGSSAKLFGKALAGGARLATRVVRGGKHIGTGLFSDDGYLDGYRKSRDRSRDAKKNGWAWTNRMRGARDDARARWGGGKVEAIRGYGRYATQVGSGGLIDWDDRGRRRTAGQRYRGERRRLRDLDRSTPQTADNADTLLQAERDRRANQERWRDERRSTRRRDRDEYRARRDARPYVLDRSDDEGYRERRQYRRAQTRQTAREHLPAIPQTARQRIEIQTAEAERAVKGLDERIRALELEIKRVNDVRLSHIQGEFDGSEPSISHVAVRAREAIEHIRTLGLDRLNTTDLGQVRGQLAGAEGVSVAASATKAEGAVSRIKSAGLEPLNGASLGNVRNELSGEANSVASSAGSAERKVTSVHTEITQLNEASLSGLKATLDGPEGSLKESVQNVKGSVTRLGNAIRDLKDISFYTILGKFDDLKSSVMDTKDRVGLPSGKTGLNYALRKLNSVDYSGKGGAESKLNDLKAKVDEVTAAALLLKGALRDINGETDGGEKGSGGGNRGGGGKGGGGGKRRSSFAPTPRGFRATGIHASFGGGSIGPSAASGAGGGASRGFAARSLMASPRPAVARSGGGGGLSRLFGLDELRELFNLTSLTRVGASAIGMDAASARLGGMGSSLRGWVGGKVRWAGGQFSDLPDRAASWMSSKMPRILMSQPEGAPWAQLAGMGMSISGPVVSQAFMDDFYHGHGNAVGRAKRMAGSIFSLDTLEELFSNVIELAKSLYEGAEDVLKLAVRFATDPKGVLSDLKDFAEEMFTGVINQVVESFKGLMSILDNPSGYAQEVWADMIEGLKEALPNLDGLFDFSKGYARGGVVAGYAPGRDSVPSLLSPGESVLRPELTKLLGTDQVDGLNSAARGGNFKKLAELIEEMWQTLIQPSFVSMSQEVKTDLTPTTERFRLVSEESWRSIGRTVQTAWNVDASPAMASWAMRLRGDMTSAEREFLGTHQSVWSQAAQLVDRSKGSSLASFSSLSGGLRGLEGQFRSSAGDIKDTWRSAMSYVDSSTRSTIDGPYNRGAVSMASAMAGLAGAKAPLSPLRFAAGGVVPGFAPGRDVVPAILSPGEGVLRPEVVRALGVDTVHAWNRSARLSGNAFAAGGIVQPLTSWGQSGGDWVTAHKADPYQGYADAIEHGWADSIHGMTGRLKDAFGVMGSIQAGAFDSFKGSVLAWGKYLDDHVGGASAAVKSAQREIGYTETGPDMVKYNEFNGEQWCADFISWVIDKAVANTSYWNSPKGTPANRWPSVATWNSEASGSLISASQARSGDIVTYRSGGHIGIVESVADGVLHTIEGNVGPTVRRLTRSLGDPDHVFRPRGGISDGPAFSGWPGAYATGVEIPDSGGLDGGTPSQNKTAAKQMLSAMGWGNQFGALDNIWTNESGWNQFAKNPSSGAYGIPQSLPADKMASAGPDWLTNAVTQMRWGLGYIRERYRTPEQAWDFWQRNHWYAKGTRSASPGLALVGEEGPELVVMKGGERVHTASETAGILGRRPVTVNVYAAPDVPTEDTILRALERAHIMHGL